MLLAAAEGAPGRTTGVTSTSARVVAAPRHTELRLGYAGVVLGVTLWSLGPLFVRAMSAPALTISTYANWIAAPVCLVAAWVAGAPLTRRVLWAALPGGLVFALTQLLAFASFQETSLANATLITTLTPIPIVIAAVPLFGERLTRAQILWGAVALAGVVAVVLGAGAGGDAHLLGDLLAVGCLFTGAAYMLVTKHRRMAGATAIAYVAGVFLVCALVQTPILLATGDAGALRGDDWVWLVMLALLTSCAGTGLMAWSQRHVNVGLTSILSLLTAVIASAGGWLFFDQQLTVAQLVGGTAVLVGLAGVLAAQFSRS